MRTGENRAPKENKKGFAPGESFFILKRQTVLRTIWHGEILVKFLPAANNHLAELLEAEGAEAVCPDLIDFINYCFYNQNFKCEFL